MMDLYMAHWHSLSREERDDYLDLVTEPDTDYKGDDGEENRERRKAEAIVFAWADSNEGRKDNERRILEVQAHRRALATAIAAEILICSCCAAQVTRSTSIQAGNYVGCADCLRADGVGHMVTW